MICLRSIRKTRLGDDCPQHIGKSHKHGQTWGDGINEIAGIDEDLLISCTDWFASLQPDLGRRHHEISGIDEVEDYLLRRRLQPRY
jgi:hypothetical protein